MAGKIENSTRLVSMNLSLEQKIGQLFFPAAFINDSDKNIQLLERQIHDYSIGGLTFFHSREMAATNYEKQKAIPKNDESHKRLRELIKHYQSIAKYPLIMSIDAEWGLAMRVENTVQYPYGLTLGAISDPYLIYEVGEAIGKDLLDTGIQLNLAPVCDINHNPANPVIGYRSFGEDKHKVTDLATAFYRGMKSVGVLGCAKHFPGHGDTSIDSHLALPIIDKSEIQLMGEELYPFKKAIESDIDVVMPGHLAVPALTGSRNTPASLSGTVIQGLLREKLGFDGTIMTDALNMHAVSKMFMRPGELELAALKAGNDILSFSSSIPQSIELISEELSAERIEESFNRLCLLKEKAGLFLNEKAKSMALSHDEVKKLRLRLASEGITEIKPGIPLSVTGLDSMACLVLNESSERSRLASHISNNKTMPIYELMKFSRMAASSIQNSINQFDRIIIALYVPNIKPTNDFGLNSQMLDWVDRICRSKRVHLAVIGNPYALKFIPYQNTERTIMTYQRIPEFEELAAQILFGKVECKGTLPITISK